MDTTFAWVTPLVLAVQTTGARIPIRPLGHEQLLLLLLQLALLLLAARGLGELMRRINLPPVVGELLAGVVLGPSLFGLLLPNLQRAIFPASQVQADLLSVVSWLGVLFLLIATGLETDLNLIVSKGKTALFTSLGGIVLPFATGFGLGMLLPDSVLANPNQRLVFSLFLATAMSISAIPVIAKVLIDLKLIRRDIGQITLASGMTDDTVGWILLSVVAGLASSGTINFGSVATSIGGALLFLAGAYFLGRPALAWLLRWVDDKVGGASASLSTVLVVALFASALTHQLGIEAALGAFVTGILAGQAPRFNREAGHTLEVITTSFLAPIFFAAAGLKVNLIQLFVPQTLLIGLVVLAIACFGKFVGVYAGARLGGRLGHWEAIALGSGMNARGAMEIIVATIGLSLGVLTQQMYTIIVMVAIITSLMAPPLLRWSLSKVVIGEDEARRLQLEEQASRSFVKNIRRVLLPTRGGTNVQLGAQLVSHMAQQNDLEVTALYAESTAVVQRGGSIPQASAESAFGAVAVEMNLPTSLQTRVESGRDPASVILKEAAKGYHLIVLGATEGKIADGTLFNSIVDRVVQEAPCATLVVKSHLSAPDGSPIALQKLRHILVPTIGTEYSKHAVELASAVAAQTGALVTLVHVVNLPQFDNFYVDQTTLTSAMEIAQQIVDQQADLGRGLGAQVNTMVLKGDSPEKEILLFAEREGVDLLVLGSNIRPISGRVFFGHRVDTLLRQATCPVAVVSSS